MEGVNVLPPRMPPLAKASDDNNGVPHPSTNVDYHLNILLASHLSNPDLTPQEIAEASRSTAAAAAIAAKAARASADEKAAAAARAIAAAKTALDLIASFPNQGLVQDACLGRDNMKRHVAADLLCSKNDELPSNLQLGDVSQVTIPNSSVSCEHKNDQCEVPLGSRERLNTEHVISKGMDFDGLGMELNTDRLNGSAAGGEGAREGIQVTRKRGRPKSK
ncbi:hypothetical protein CARUB_v10028466mg [Capsella rubella]|uniref:Uncharacterized protein n=1 Tax=Capsella rubella TaxID=81985 RepID=R0GVC6_9BRAS|nr:uncharacterized protein LOC17876839 [Capsella rubella]XP_023641498.1 uncharacterized protein LOC17876839 [Capsella rubella]EOA15098.1 hypothetical protein CARUB_v10028466mg [Capsella rubella]